MRQISGVMHVCTCTFVVRVKNSTTKTEKQNKKYQQKKNKKKNFERSIPLQVLKQLYDFLFVIHCLYVFSIGKDF